jgi:hypothetical protein
MVLSLFKTLFDSLMIDFYICFLSVCVNSNAHRPCIYPFLFVLLISISFLDLHHYIHIAASSIHPDQRQTQVDMREHTNSQTQTGISKWSKLILFTFNNTLIFWIYGFDWFPFSDMSEETNLFFENERGNKPQLRFSFGWLLYPTTSPDDS